MGILQIIVITLTIISLFLTGLSAYFEKEEKHKSVKKTLYWIFLSGFLLIILQAKREVDVSKNEDKADSIEKVQLGLLAQKSNIIKNLEIKSLKKTDSLLIQQNTLLIQQNNNLQITNRILNYSTGGKDNKPVLTTRWSNLAVNSETPNSFSIKFCMQNYGNYPLENVYFYIDDYYTAQFEKLADQGKYNERDVDTTKILNRMDYERKKKYGTIRPHGQTCEYEGYIVGGKKELFYNVRIEWTNGAYNAFYHFIYNEEKKILEIVETKFSANGEEVDPMKFFPLAPKTLWKRY